MIGLPYDKALLCLDKYLFYEYLITNGIYTPLTYIEVDKLQTDLKAGRIHYPLIIKNRWGMGSKGLAVVHSEDDLKNYNNTGQASFPSFLGAVKNPDLNVVYQDIDAVEVMDSVIDVFNMIAGLKKITIREEKPEKLPVCADIDMLKTVIRNLLSNAIKFSNENSEVLVKMEEQGDMVVVSVKDNGCGIDEEGQKKLLHTDTHFSTFGTNNEEGSGLGLLLCQDFVVKNGGKLWFTSKQGEGSTFYFSIPLKK